MAIPKFTNKYKAIKLISVALSLQFFDKTIQLMDQRLTSSQKKHNQNQSSKHHQIMQSMKNCVDYVRSDQICHSTSKPIDVDFHIITYCNYIEKALKKLVNIIPRQMIGIDIHQKLLRQFDQLNENYQFILKDYRDYKCEINVLQSQLAEAELREKNLIEQKQKQKLYTKQFSKKLETVKRQSESKLEKIGSPTLSGEYVLKGRKKSLPTIMNVPRARLPSRSSIHVAGLPTDEQKTQRLVEHLRKKY